MEKVDRGEKQWKRYFLNKLKIHKNSLTKESPILELGCGEGEFVRTGLKYGYKIFGIDVIQRWPEDLKDNCVLYDGERIPFESNNFVLIYSWYVLEHIKNLEEVLREIVRVTKENGILVLFAQDARTAWEGHAKIPWLPFMPKYLMKDWLSAFGKIEYLDYITNSVYYITTPQVVTVLEACNCKILEQSVAPNSLITNHSDIECIQNLENLEKIKRKWEKNDYRHDNDIIIVARKS